MTDKLFATIWADAQAATDPDAFASDWATSSAILPAEDPEADIDMDLVSSLQALWHVAHDPVRDLLGLLGLSQTGCAIRFCIPLRTIQDWVADKRTPPAYIRLMVAEAVGLVALRSYGQS